MEFGSELVFFPFQKEQPPLTEKLYKCKKYRTSGIDANKNKGITWGEETLMGVFEESQEDMVPFPGSASCFVPSAGSLSWSEVLAPTGSTSTSSVSMGSSKSPSSKSIAPDSSWSTVRNASTGSPGGGITQSHHVPLPGSTKASPTLQRQPTPCPHAIRISLQSPNWMQNSTISSKCLKWIAEFHFHSEDLGTLLGSLGKTLKRQRLVDTFLMGIKGMIFKVIIKNLSAILHIANTICRNKM
ncbi:hypothetical protein DBR06_SOUSAS14710055 [Sousa chinensis]|nr:hypothetical protein DBR06_SOUSAS14710055 [Sousa chinensis]